MAATVPWSGARLIDISRRGAPDAEHVEADLTDPSSWPVVAASFRQELQAFSGDRVIFVHAAGTIQPIGFAAEVDTGEYTHNVILNSVTPQVLGHAFLAAAKDVDAHRQLLMLTSGAARSVYPGWSSYGAGKAAMDQWVRIVGAEQEERGGVQVAAVTPGAVETGMQEHIRQVSERDFPKRQKFVDLHESGQLAGVDTVADDIWTLLDAGLENGAVVDLREVTAP